MSLDELFNAQFVGFNFFSVMGIFVTLGICLSCICRINAMPPVRGLHISSEALLYLGYALWSADAFVSLLFFQVFYGHDLAIGLWIMLNLHSTYRDWQGDDCVSDTLNFWRLKEKQRIDEINQGINYGRRARDRR